MAPHHTYHTITVGDIPHHKQMKLLKTGILNLTEHELAGSKHTLHLHPESHAKAHKAKHSHKGVRIKMTTHEIHHNALHGHGIFSSIKDFLSKHGTAILDSAAAVGKVIAPEAAPFIDASRELARHVTGKGIHKKSSEAVHEQRLANLAKARAAKKHKKSHAKGGSFLQAGY